MAITVREIQRMLETLAPSALAESWDNVGLLVGDPAGEVTGVLVALDATAAVLDQAAAREAQLLVVHHPLIFSGLKRLTEDGGTSNLVRRLVREGRGLLALHTNLDSAPEGLNQYVADLLGLYEIRPLIPSEARLLLKLVVYVPATHADAVRAAIGAAGAGHIGHYAECTFGVEGTGTFRPEAGTHPFIGQAGVLERVPEMRLETVVPRAALGRVLPALLASHPYEEVAYDLLPLENSWPGAGLGRIGILATPITAGTFRDLVNTALGTRRALLVGRPERLVRTVALCTGSGGDFAEQAFRAGADCYLTGEVKHHQALLARDRDWTLVDAGHFPTERPAVDLLASRLSVAFPALHVTVADEHDPFGG